MAMGVGCVSGYLNRVYVSYCRGLHLLGRLHHLLHSLIADIGTLGDVPGMAGYKHIVVVGAGLYWGRPPSQGSLLIFRTLSQNNWLRHMGYGVGPYTIWVFPLYRGQHWYGGHLWYAAAT